MSKEISKGHEARMKIKAGIKKAADAVRPSLGAVGSTAVIAMPGLDPIEADDGFTILKHLEFKDPYEQIGLLKLKKAAARTSIEGRDGTASTTVFTDALSDEALKEILPDDSNIRDVYDRLQIGRDQAIFELSKMKRDITQEDIESVAQISSLNTEVSKLIAETIKEVGVNGVVTVEKGAKLGYSKEVVKGARFDKGLISPYFINDEATLSTILHDPYIILVDRVISTNEQVLSLLNSIGTGKDILFIADAVQSVALGTLAQNALNKIANIACVQNPYSASRAKDFLFDIAALTGATVISEEKGMRLDTSTVEVCGRAEKVVVTKDYTTIIGGKPSEALQARIASIQGELESTTSEYTKLMLEDRLASLTGGIGVIRVGAYTDTEFNAKKYKFDNAISSSQMALQEGIIPGGGAALAKIATSNLDPMFRRALVSTFCQQAMNAGIYDKRNLIQKLFGKKPSVSKALGLVQTSSASEGYNFRTKKFVDLFVDGVIDPFKVSRLVIESGTAIVSDLVNYNPAIVDEKEEKTI